MTKCEVLSLLTSNSRLKAGHEMNTEYRVTQRSTYRRYIFTGQCLETWLYVVALSVAVSVVYGRRTWISIYGKLSAASSSRSHPGPLHHHTPLWRTAHLSRSAGGRLLPDPATCFLVGLADVSKCDRGDIGAKLRFVFEVRCAGVLSSLATCPNGALRRLMIRARSRHKACSSCCFDVTDMIERSDPQDMSLTLRVKGVQAFSVCSK